MIVAQYKNGWNFFDAIWSSTKTMTSERKSAVPAR